MGLFSGGKPPRLSSVPGYGLLPAKQKKEGFLSKAAPFLAIAAAAADPTNPMSQFALQASYLNRQQRASDKKEMEAKAALDAMAKEVITDPTEWAAYQIDPKGWASKHMADLYDFHEVTEGNDAFWGNPKRPGAVSYHRPKKREIDGVVFNDDTGAPQYESPYPKIIPGTEGSFFTQPRIGIGQGAAPPVSPQPAGEEVTATNPQTGQKVRLNHQTGQWEPIGGAGLGPRTFP